MNTILTELIFRFRQLVTEAIQCFMNNLETSCELRHVLWLCSPWKNNFSKYISVLQMLNCTNHIGSSTTLLIAGPASTLVSLTVLYIWLLLILMRTSINPFTRSEQPHNRFFWWELSFLKFLATSWVNLLDTESLMKQNVLKGEGVRNLKALGNCDNPLNLINLQEEGGGFR